MKDKLTKNKLLEILLLSINESRYLSMFPGTMGAEYSKLGYVAITNHKSKIRQLLEVQATALIDHLERYELPEPKKLTRVEKRAIQKSKIAQEKADRERFDHLEKAWKEDGPRAHQEMLDNAQLAAENILAKQKTLKPRD